VGEIPKFDCQRLNKHSEQVFHQPDDFYQQWFEQIAKACFSISADSTVRAVNGWALRLLGFRRDELLGRSVLDLYANMPLGKARAEELFFRFIGGAEITREKLQMQCADGSPLWISLTARPIRASNGQIVASCSMVEEIVSDPILCGENSVASPLPSSLAWHDCKRDLHQTSRWIIKSAKGIHFLNVDEIDWIGAAGNYAELHVGSRVHLVRETMNRLEARLGPSQFIRVHRRVIVNVTRMKELEPCASGDYRLILNDGTRLTLSRTYREKLKGIWLS